MKTVTVRAYECGALTIMKAQSGYRHGLEWCVWRGGNLLHTARTLRQAKLVAATSGAQGAWLLTKGGHSADRERTMGDDEPGKRE